jgi:hypothetical protein
MSHQAVSGLKVPQCSGGLQITHETFGGCDGKIQNCLPITDGWKSSVSIRVTSFGRSRTLLVRAQFRKTRGAPFTEVVTI